MIPQKPRRLKTLKLPKNLERQYKQSKCRDCTVVVTRMDFAKILGKFTKVKIQYESSSTVKSKQSTGSSNLKLENNENGIVNVHQSAYSSTPIKKRPGPGRPPKNKGLSSPKQANNVLKENNMLKKSLERSPTYNSKKKNNSKLKHYGIVFVSPTSDKNDVISKISLDALLPTINNNILPSDDWCIEYFPNNGEPKDDKIYDRIAAELEDLMYNEKTKNSSDSKDSKNDEFPSILDILNDNSKVIEKTNEPSSTGTLESSDVEAMLLGKPKEEPAAMEIDTPDVSSFITENTSLINENNIEVELNVKKCDDNPNSPSILDEEMTAEVPVLSVAEKPEPTSTGSEAQTLRIDENENTNTKNKNRVRTGVTQVTFKKTDGTSSKTVTCPKNLNYTISIQGKAIELLGAPKVISSLEDLTVLLQIVEESELDSLYVLH